MNDFKMVVWCKRDRYYVHCPELALLVHDTDRNAAFDKMNAALAAQKIEYDGAGLPFPPLEAKAASAIWDSGLTRLLVKTASVCLVASVVIGTVLGVAVDTTVRRASSHLTELKGNGLHKMTEKLRNASPEEQARRHQDLETLGSELQWLLRPLSCDTEKR